MNIRGLDLKKRLALVLVLLSSISYAQFHVDTTGNYELILNSFINPKGGIYISNVTFSGDKNSIGLFRNNVKEFPLEKGIIISTGDVWDAIGPNDKGNSGVNHYSKGDHDLEKLANGKTYDAAVFEFDFRANSDSVGFEFIFASEEYPEYVNKGVNDVFGFLVSDQSIGQTNNIAKCEGLPITVDNINASKNSNYFISNRRFNLSEKDYLSYSLQFDGISRKLYTGLKIQPYRLYHFKICISDVGDGQFDSAVMLRGNSFISNGDFDWRKYSNEFFTLLATDLLTTSLDSAEMNLIPDIKFDFDSYSVPDSSFEVINKLVEIMNKYFDIKMDIYGYSDNIGEKEYNLNLSEKRAKSIYDFLIQNGINESRINYFGFGSENSSNIVNSKNIKAENRKVVIRIFR